MKEKKEKKEKQEDKALSSGEQTVATVGNRPRLLAWEGVLERRSFISKRNAVFVETVGIRPGPPGEE